MVDHTLEGLVLADPSPLDHTWHSSAQHIQGPLAILHGINLDHVALLCAS